MTGEGFGYANGIRISYAASMEDLEEALGEVRRLMFWPFIKHQEQEYEKKIFSKRRLATSEKISTKCSGFMSVSVHIVLRVVSTPSVSVFSRSVFFFPSRTTVLLFDWKPTGMSCGRISSRTFY